MPSLCFSVLIVNFIPGRVKSDQQAMETKALFRVREETELEFRRESGLRIYFQES